MLRNQLQCIFGYFNEQNDSKSDNDEDNQFISNLNEKQEWKNGENYIKM